MNKNKNKISVGKDNANFCQEIEHIIQGFQKQILDQHHHIENLVNTQEELLDSIFRDLITILDSFDKADMRLAELFQDSKEVGTARKRFASSRKRLDDLLKKNGVSEITFPDGLATLNDCQISDTEPNADHPNDTILSIEKKGYRRNGRLLRLAEVIVVKN